MSGNSAFEAKVRQKLARLEQEQNRLGRHSGRQYDQVPAPEALRRAEARRQQEEAARSTRERERKEASATISNFVEFAKDNIPPNLKIGGWFGEKGWIVFPRFQTYVIPGHVAGYDEAWGLDTPDEEVAVDIFLLKRGNVGKIENRRTGRRATSLTPSQLMAEVSNDLSERLSEAAARLLSVEPPRRPVHVSKWAPAVSF